MKIPVLPISWADAQPLLAALGGRWPRRSVARRPADHLPPRPRPGQVRLKLEFDWARPAYDVIAVLQGPSAPTSGSSGATTTTPG
jgi:N-acetylated-alpha-linked acidic dipeptidase